MIERVCGLWFSPCGNVEKTVRAMGSAAAARLGVGAEYADVTLPTAREQAYRFGPDALVFVGAPVYAGRLPNKIAPFFREAVLGAGALAVPAVCFGNRSFDNALAELFAILGQNGFTVPAAAAIPTEHSFTSALAPGRPTAADLAEAAAFAVRVAERCARGEHVPALDPARVPGDGNAPYYTPLGTDGKPAMFLKAVPAVDEAKCVRCGTCADLCPMGSVDRADPGKMNGVCIKCHACIRRCPAGARSFTDPAFLSHRAMLEQNYARPAQAVYIE